MAAWTSNISFPFSIIPIMGKKHEKPINKPAPDPKPHEGSGHSDKGNGSKSNSVENKKGISR